MNSFFVSDLHGKMSRYKSLFEEIQTEKPSMVFIGGDLSPMPYKYINTGNFKNSEFLAEYLIPHLEDLKKKLGESYPRIFIIMGNDDTKINEPLMFEAEKVGIWDYIHNRKVSIELQDKSGETQVFGIYGYGFVPPTPFRLKDWEKYDVSRFTDVGCIPPTEGIRSVDVNPDEIEYTTIMSDIEALTNNDNLSRSILLFHSPPYQTNLDRAELDGQMVDHIPVDVNVGSIAIKRFIEEKQPYLTLHGHIHESSRITGNWQDKIGNSFMFIAAYDGPELALVKFDISDAKNAKRYLI